MIKLLHCQKRDLLVGGRIGLLYSSLPTRFGLEDRFESLILPWLCGVHAAKPRRGTGGSFHFGQLEVITSPSHIHGYIECFTDSNWKALVRPSPLRPARFGPLVPMEGYYLVLFGPTQRYRLFLRQNF